MRPLRSVLGRIVKPPDSACTPGVRLAWLMTACVRVESCDEIAPGSAIAAFYQGEPIEEYEPKTPRPAEPSLLAAVGSAGR